MAGLPGPSRQEPGQKLMFWPWPEKPPAEKRLYGVQSAWPIPRPSPDNRGLRCRPAPTPLPPSLCRYGPSARASPGPRFRPLSFTPPPPRPPTRCWPSAGSRARPSGSRCPGRPCPALRKLRPPSPPRAPAVGGVVRAGLRSGRTAPMVLAAHPRQGTCHGCL